MTQAAAQKKPDKKERLARYASKLRALKERGSMREVTERELLLEFININRSHINEFPMLETQQNSVINLLCHRSVDHPGHEYIRNLISTFISRLTHFSKAVEVGDAAQAADRENELLNSETLLIKCVQGAVYASALTADNFEEVIIRFFGAKAIPRYNKLLETAEMNEAFWKALIDQFVTNQVKAIYKDMVDEEQYSLTREKTLLVIRWGLDDILNRLERTSQNIDKTRVQTYFEKNFTEDEYKNAQKHVLLHLKNNRTFIAPGGTDADVLYITRITCIDSASLEFAAESAKRKGGQGEYDPKEEDQWAFLKEQVLATAVGSAIAVDIVREDFIRASSAYRPKELEAIRSMVHYFDMSSLHRLLLYLLESHFCHLLQDKGMDEGSKVRIRSIRRRRTPVKMVERLQAVGMSKVRKHKIWEKDPSNSAMMLFKPRTLKELSGYAQVLQIEPPLAAELKKAWDKSPYKVDILLIFDLALISRTTTNLKVKLAELFGKFELSPGRKNGAPNGQPAGAAPAAPESAGSAG